MKQPKVIFLDAVGTLFGVKGSVGEIYSAIAQSAGVTVSAEVLNKAFIKSFSTSESLAFPGVNIQEIPSLEYQWWYAVAQSTFTQAGIIGKFSDFEGFFRQLYDHFATKEPWFVYTDVLNALTAWQQQGIQLGIISNFDSRIHIVLERLGLKDFFSSITISSFTGVAKPNQQIFFAALAKHNCLPQQAWHIGDSLSEDYYGAKAVGIKPFLIKR